MLMISKFDIYLCCLQMKKGWYLWLDVENQSFT